MNQKEKNMIGGGLLLLAYAYEISGYHPAALLFGLLAAVSAVQCHSLRCLQRCLLRILLAAGAEAVLIRLLGLEQTMPLLPALSLFNAAYAVLTMESSFQAAEDLAFLFLKILAGAMALVMILPDSLRLRLASASPASAALECALLLTIFLPLAAAYLQKCRRCGRRGMWMKALHLR